MMRDEQAERDRIARVLDTWLAIVQIEIAVQERLAIPTAPPTPIGVSEHWLRQAS